MRFLPLSTALTLLLTPALLAQHEDHGGGAEAAMPPEMAAMMAALEAAGTPGEHHQRLATMTGTWTVSTTMWMPGAPEPMRGTGTAERTMILGGRVLDEQFHGEAMGQSFEGSARTGWDNVTKQWWSTWSDTMSTGLFVLYGQTTDKGTEVYTGSMADPMGGPAIAMRVVAVAESPDREVHTFYEKQGDGEERKSMELIYERRK